MKIEDLPCSISHLTNSLIDISAAHFETQGLTFDRTKFTQEISPMIEFVSETAHFTGANALPK